jgi:hypothetical protein
MLGRSVIEQMLNTRQLERVPASRDLADIYIGQARAALVSAARVSDDDPRSAYSILYDSARFALTAVLENQGLRPTNNLGAHRVVYDAVMAQLEPPKGPTIRPFNEMRRMRHSVEYGEIHIPDDRDVADTIPLVEDIIDMAVRVLDDMPVF